jgi:hypothetical protein
VAAERRGEQALVEQQVGAAANGAGQEQAVHDGEERYLQQRRQAAGEHPGPFLRVQGRQLALQPFWLPGVALVQLLDPRRYAGLRPLPPECVVAEGQHQQPHHDREQDDRRRDRQPAQQRGERARKRENQMVGGIDRQAKQSKHDGSPSSGASGNR